MNPSVKTPKTSTATSEKNDAGTVNATISPAVHVSVSPHIRAGNTTASIMRDVLIALVPACGMGVYTFGLRVLAVIAACVASCVLTEFVYEKLMKQPVTVGDLSAAVTGVILAANLPATIPLWMPALGGVFAILVVKLLFGGIGQNFMNPALAARCFLLISFAGAMTAFPETVRLLFDGGTVSGATPMAALKAGEASDWFGMLFNTHNGSIGESSPVAILVGAVYMLCRRVISLRIPGVYILSTLGFVALIQLITGNADLLTVNYLVTHLCGGGLLIGAFFMANDYTTSPITPMGQVVYALFLGLMTALFRTVGSAVEGVSYAILLGNLLVPIIERFTMPRPFGVSKKRRA